MFSLIMDAQNFFIFTFNFLTKKIVGPPLELINDRRRIVSPVNNRIKTSIYVHIIP
jgi:hypothetical protein